MRLFGFDIKLDGIYTDNDYYICWWNWLPKEIRYWGRQHMWYDGPHCSFGLWFINIHWSFPWTKWTPWK